MPKVTDPALLAALGGGAGPRPMVALPPKAPAGYGVPGAQGIAPLQGGPADPRQAAMLAAAEASARASASTPIEVAGQLAAARGKSAIELQADAIKRQREAKAAALAATKLSPANRAEAMNQIASLKGLRNQLERSAQEFDRTQNNAGGDRKGGLLGTMREYLPAFMNGTNDKYDATVSGITPLAKSAFRTPGEGTFDKADLNLFLGMMPGRYKTDEGNVQRYKQMRAMIDDRLRSQYGMLGMKPPGRAAGKPAAKGKQSNVINFNDLPE